MNATIFAIKALMFTDAMVPKSFQVISTLILINWYSKKWLNYGGVI